MCWCTKKPAVLKMAEKDREVFKIVEQVDGKLSSYYKLFPYEIGKLYETRIGDRRVDFGRLCIKEGFHSYSNKCKWEPMYEDSITAHKVIFGNLVLDICCTSYKYVRVNCIIPKGALYYENEKGEIVSDKIIIKEIIDD